MRVAVSECLSLHFAARIMLVFSLFARAISQNIGDVRLVLFGAVGGNAGRVEVYSDFGPGNATWARLCDEEWNRNIARVVCQQLGFDDVQILFNHNFRRSPFGRGRQESIIRVQMCSMPNTDATSLNEAGCQHSRCTGRGIDAGVVCLVRPIGNPMLQLNSINPTPAIVTTSTVQVQTMPTIKTTTTPTTMPSPTSEATSTVSTTLTITSTTTNVTSDLMTTDSYITLDRLPRKDLNVTAICIGVILSCFIIAIIVIVIVLHQWCKRKITKTKQTSKTEGGGSIDSENNFPDTEYKYNGVSTVEKGLNMSSNISGGVYQNSPVGPNKVTDVEPRVPKQDSIDEYQYSAVGPIQNGTNANPRVPKQDSIDEYQYSAVGPIQNGADVDPRVPIQDSDDDDFYAPVGAISSDSLTPKATAFSNVCTDESFYIIPDRSEVNPYQELAVKTSTFAGLQKLRKKPVLEQNPQRAPEIKVTKQPPVKPKKPIRKSQTPTDDTSVQISGKPHLPTEVDNAVYGLEVIGEQNACAASSSLADGQTDDQCESIYANADIELREILPSGSTATTTRDSTIHGGIQITDAENPYENSIIGDQSFLQEQQDSDYQ